MMMNNDNIIDSEYYCNDNIIDGEYHCDDIIR